MFMIAVPLLSLMNLPFLLTGSRPLVSGIVSLIGIAGAILFLLNKRQYVQCMFAWALLQLVIVTSVTGFRQLGQMYITGINWNWDLAQFFEFQWNLTWTGKASGALSGLVTGINFPAIAYIALAIWLKKDSVPGVSVKMKALKSDSFLAGYLPAEATIIRRATLGDETNWYLVQLNGKTPETYFFIRPKDDFFLKPRQSQMVACLKIADPQWVLTAATLDRKQFSTGSWAITNPS